jgi:PEP-CTERM motif
MDTATFNDATFASLGVSPGAFVWSLGSSASDDTFTLDIIAPAAVPEPSSFLLLAGALAGLITLAATRRRQY